jgi:hypothetical protein
MGRRKRLGLPGAGGGADDGVLPLLELPDRSSLVSEQNLELREDRHSG